MLQVAETPLTTGGKIHTKVMIECIVSFALHSVHARDSLVPHYAIWIKKYSATNNKHYCIYGQLQNAYTLYILRDTTWNCYNYCYTVSTSGIVLF